MLVSEQKITPNLWFDDQAKDAAQRLTATRRPHSMRGVGRRSRTGVTSTKER